MVEKSQHKSDIINKGRINTFFGVVNLYSVRDKLRPVFSFNSHSIILIFVSIFVFMTTFTGSYQSFNLLVFFIAFDLLLASIIVKPIFYIKSGYEVYSTSELKRTIINYEISNKEIKIFFKWFLLRLILYVIITLALSPVSTQDLTTVRNIFYVIWYVTFSILVILIMVTFSMIGLGFLVDDYLNEGSTHKAVSGFRLELSKSALELDKVISRINNSQNSVVSKEYRQKLAGAIFKLRNFLVIEDSKDSSYTPEMKVRFIQAEKEFSLELLENLRKDKCVVCYAQLMNATGPFLACPICGQGGHKEHIEEWFQTKEICPGCNTDMSASNFLVLN